MSKKFNKLPLFFLLCLLYMKFNKKIICIFLVILIPLLILLLENKESFSLGGQGKGKKEKLRNFKKSAVAGGKQLYTKMKNYHKRKDVVAEIEPALVQRKKELEEKNTPEKRQEMEKIRSGRNRVKKRQLRDYNRILFNIALDDLVTSSTNEGRPLLNKRVIRKKLQDRGKDVARRLETVGGKTLTVLEEDNTTMRKMKTLVIGGSMVAGATAAATIGAIALPVAFPAAAAAGTAASATVPAFVIGAVPSAGAIAGGGASSAIWRRVAAWKVSADAAPSMDTEFEKEKKIVKNRLATAEATRKAVETKRIMNEATAEENKAIAADVAERLKSELGFNTADIESLTPEQMVNILELKNMNMNNNNNNANSNNNENILAQLNEFDLNNNNNV